MTTPGGRRPSGNNSTPSSGRRRDTNRIVPQPTSTGSRTTGSSDKSRGSHQSHQHSTKTEAGKVKDKADQSDEALIADRVEATKKLIKWAIEDLANTIGAFKEMQKILENQEKKRDKDVASIYVFGPINMTKKHWGFNTKISEYKETARAEIAFWQNAEREAEAAKAEWEKNLEFLNGTVFAEAIKAKPGDKNKTSWKAVWEAGSRNAPWQKYEQINNTITSYYAKTWQGETFEAGGFFSSSGRELKQKLDDYVKRSRAH
ncbi:hypothetical protein A7U60_g6336 [Sanghuangporus baumii]|uniref:Uncharacterized protein n=1 Tax=Sanghuangporus baumii TaxID=108892 RepID=A0A9Q5HVI9_SANBA|nr:hypothetical protein A7U60_g6336 [Sanghuangporus baumii]